MRRALLGFAALVMAFPGGSGAADLMRAPVMKAPPPVVAPFSWNGFYIGGHAGYGWMGSTDHVSRVSGSLDPGIDLASSIPLDPRGFVGGGQIGYNWQVSPLWVLGVEADISWTDFDATAARQGPADPSRIVTASQRLGYLGTVRGRVGVTPADRWLVYATGGFAYGRASLSTALTRTTGSGCAANNCQQGSISDTLSGWTAGGGAEWAFTRNWSVKAEYLYFDLGDLSHPMTDSQFPSIGAVSISTFDTWPVAPGSDRS
jgi:outer membrane immunogenic protein